jgi:hypothetical protein
MERRIHPRRPVDFPVQVTELTATELTASGSAEDISESGIGVNLPVRFKPGTVVRLNVNDSVLFGFVAHSTPIPSGYRTGIEVVQVLLGTSGIAQLLKATLEGAMPSLQVATPPPEQTTGVADDREPRIDAVPGPNSRTGSRSPE